MSPAWQQQPSPCIGRQHRHPPAMPPAIALLISLSSAIFRCDRSRCVPGGSASTRGGGGGRRRRDQVKCRPPMPHWKPVAYGIENFAQLLLGSGAGRHEQRAGLRREEQR